MTRKLLLILAIFNIALALTCAIVLTSMFLDSFPLFTDFYSLYSGWSLTAQRADVYDLGVQGARQTALLGASFPGGVLPYVSPPHAGLLFAPLAWLSLVLPTAAIVSLWNAARVLLAAWLVRELWRELDGIDRLWHAVIISGIVAAPPLWLNFATGNLSIIVTICALQLWRGRDSWRGGAWLFLATVKPHLIVLPVAALIRERRYKPIVSALACGGVAAIAVTLWLGPGVWESWLNAVREFGTLNGQCGIAPERLPNLRALLLRVTEGNDSLATSASYAALALAFALFMWRGSLLAALAVGPFLAPHVGAYDLLLLAVPLVSLLASTAGGRFSFPVLSLRALTRTCHNRTGRH